MFQFKQFAIYDENTPMKVGVDSVLLGSWINIENNKSVLDIGSGSGLLSFMLAQRYSNLFITGIEIYKPAFDDSIQNLKKFHLPCKIQFLNEDFLSAEFTHGFDYIISNPPYFTDAINIPDIGRMKARFSQDLSLSKMISKASSLLNAKGSFSLIFSLQRFEELNIICLENNLQLARKTIFYHNQHIRPKRVLLEYVKNSKQIIENKLIMKDEKGNYTAEYRTITKEFYLKF